MICCLKQTRWTLIGIVLAGLVTDSRALDTNRLPSQYARRNRPPKPDLPAALSMALRKPQMDTSGLGLTEA